MTRLIGWLLFGAIIVAGLVWMAKSAQAQGANCAPRESAIAQLAEKWSESLRSVMLAQGGVYEVYAAETGTWTILRTTPDGESCIMASGLAYEAVKVVEGDPA